MNFFEKNYKKNILLTGVLFFSFLFYLSWVFFKERILCFDPAYFAFLMIDEKGFSISQGRWGGIFSELLPLFALKNGCSLKTFLHLFSIAPIVNYFIIFLIITLELKNYRAAIALILSLCLGFRHVFYYTNVELYVGIAVSILLWAIIAPEKEYSSKIKKRTALIVSLFLVYTLSYLHQLTVFAILFIVIAELLGNKRYKDVHLWIVLIATIVWYFIRLFVFNSSQYETEKIPTLTVFIEQLPFIFSLPSTIYFKFFSVHYLWPLLLTFIICCVFLFKMRNWLYFIFLPVFTIVFLIIILITYYKGESPLMYENYYTVFGIFAAVPFVFVLYANFKEKWRLLFVVSLLVVNLIGIYNAHEILTKRVEYIEHLVNYGKKQENKKFLISAQNFQWQMAWVKWAVPFETALYSAMDGPDSTVTFFISDDINKYDSLINKKNVFLGPEWAVSSYTSENFQKEYFNFPSTGYKKLNSSQADSSFHEEVFNKDNFLIKLQEEKYYSGADSFIYVPLKVVNLSGKKLASIPTGLNQVFLSYHIYDANGNMLIQEGKKTPFDVDIIDTYTQGLMVTLPDKKGKYVVEVDPVTENKRWWGINTKFTLVVR